MAYAIIDPGSPSGDSVSAIADYLANYSANIVNAGNEFINDIGALKETNYFAITDLPTLGFMYTDVTNDTNELRAALPTRPDMSLTSIQSLIEQLAALAVPDGPVLVQPVIDVPDLSATAPIITLPATPVVDAITAPGDAPTINDVVLPDAPTIILPVTPTFEEFALPTPPSFSLPNFDLEAPQNQVGPFTERFVWNEPEYESELRDPLVQKLLNDLINGGYGIESYDEQALWGRARDRETAIAEAEMVEIRREAASTGMPLPSGAMRAALMKARYALSTKVASLSRDIALKRADLYVENRKFTIEQVQKFEDQSIQLFNATAERSLNYAKSVVELGALVYQQHLKSFELSLDAYKTEADVFETRVRAELGKAEIFKTQVEAASLQLGIQKAKADLYRAQLEGINTVVQVYRSRLEAANISAEIQKTKLEGFRIRVQAYAETVRAQEAKFNMYEASVKGEIAKLEVYRTEIDAYNKVIQGLELRSRIALQSNDSLLKQYSANINRYETQVESFVKQLSAKLDQARATSTIYQSDVAAYNALVHAITRSADLNVRNQEMNNDWNKAALTSRVEAVKFSLGKLNLTVENLKDINKWGAEFYRTGFAAAISGINGLTVKSE